MTGAEGPPGAGGVGAPARRGLFLTFEGGEGSGKTTQVVRLAARIEALGRRVLVTREPGGSPLGNAIRDLLVRQGADPPVPIAEILLYAADRAHHVSTIVRPALEAGSVVLCDRYADATEAYQGWGRGLPEDLVRTANALAMEGLWPERTLILDLDPAEGVRRALERENPRASGEPGEARFEGEALAFHERVRDGYRAIARRDPERVKLLDARGSIDDVARRVWEAVRDLFE